MADDFLGTYAPLANDIATRTGVDPSVVLGIIDTETGGGKRVLGNNIFGISPPGGVARYPDVQAAANAFVTLMQTPRYRGVAAAGDPASQAAALVKSGYNTVNPKYAGIVANKALNFGKQLGYQDSTSGDTKEGPAVYSTSSQPVASADQPAPDDSFVPAGSAQPAQPPATTSSAKDRVLSDPALGGNATSAAPASGGTAKDRVLNDPALKTTDTTTTMQETAPAQDPYSGAPTSDDYQPSPAVTGALSRVGQAAAEGWQGGTMQTPDAYAANQQTLLGKYGVNPLVELGNLPFRALNALGRGGMQAIYEAGEPLGRALPEIRIPDVTLPGDSSITYPGGITIDRPGRGFGGTVAGGPGLGRDLNLLAQVAPVAQAEGGMMRAATQPPVAPEVNALRPRFVSEIAAPPRPPGMSDAARINQLVEHAVNEEQPAVGPPMATGLGYRPDVDPTKPFTYNPPSSGWPAGTDRWAEGGGPQAAPVLTAEERAWAAGAQERLQEIRAENQAAGVPGDLGAAATPEQLAQLTPQQMKAYRRQAELGEALAPAERGMDRKIYVEGSKPTKAEYSADPEISQQESLERERAPKQHDAVQEENNAARVRKFEGMMGSDIQVDDLKVAKAKAAETDGNAFLQAARPIDLKPAAEWIDGQLADPRVQARPDVVKKLGDLRKSLFDADGNMRTEPGYGWGLHDEAMADLEKAKDTTRAERYSKSQLLQWKKIIDGVNDDASDGAFRKFLDNQSNYASRINALEELQKYRPKLTSGKTGMILPTSFHRFVADLAMRRGNPGIDAAMDIPDETMRGLLNIGKDLKRADNIDLGKARGSNTNLLFSLAKGTGIGMAHAAFSAMPGTTGVGNILLQGALDAAGKATGNVLLRRRVNRSLAPPPGGYDYSPVQQGPP